MTTHGESRLPTGAELRTEDGLVVQRRSFLGLAAAALVGSRAPRARLTDPRDEPHLTLEEFVAEAVPVARELRAELGANPARALEDRYLFTIASYACRLADVAPPPSMKPSSQGDGVTIGASWVGDPFVVLHWRIEPGASIRPHAHTYGNVCTVGLEGVARVRNYETVEALDVEAEGEVAVRRTADQRLDPGAINVVPLSHGFCHGFDAGPDGARGLDITTRLAERRPTPYLELVDRDADADVLRATWRVE